MNLFAGSAVFLAAFLSFLSRVCPTVYADDSPETVTAAITLGITHPPGDPLLALAGRAWGILPLGSMALRQNLLSAFLASLACLLAVRLVAGIFPGRLPALAASFTALALFIFNPVLVQQAAVAKGAVYTLNLVLILWAVLALQGKRQLSAALAMGLLVAHHWMTFAAVSPVLLPWWGLNIFRSGPGKSRSALASLFFVLIGVSTLVYLPLRASPRNYLSWGNPANFQRMSSHFLRRVYLPEEMRGTTVTWRRQGIMGAMAIEMQAGWPGLVLAGLGIAALFSIGRLPAAAAIAGLAVPWLITSVYLDLRPDLVHLLGIYLFPSWLVAALLGIAGSAWLAGMDRRRIIILPFILALGTAGYLLPSVRYFNVSRSTWSFDIARIMLAPLPRGAGLLVNSDLDTFPLWYMQAVEECRPDVLVVNTTIMRHQWYREHIEDYSGVSRLRELDDRDSAVRYLVFSSRRKWFSAAGDIPGVPAELPRTPFHLTYRLDGGARVPSFRGFPSRSLFECWHRLPEKTASLCLDYISEVFRNINAKPRH